MKIYYRILSCLTVVLLTFGCSERLSFDELVKNVPSDPNVHSYSSTKMNYSISLLDRFKFVDKEYNDTLAFELFVDTMIEFEEGASTLSILKFKSTDTTLNNAWDKLISNRVLIEDFRIYSNGLTDYLSQPSYYEHSACTISKKNTETISFLFHGEASTFYLLSLQVNTDKGYPINLKELLFSAKSLRVLP